MCKRNRVPAQTLLSVFLESYGVNLLTIPRRDAEPGDLYVMTGDAPDSILKPGGIEHVLTKNFAMPEITRNEAMADVAASWSHAVDFGVGLKLLSRFLNVLGIGPVMDAIEAEYRKQKSTQLEFRMQNATRDALDHLELGTVLSKHQLLDNHPSVADGNRYFVTTGVVRTPSLTLKARTESKTAVGLDVGALKILDADGKLTIDALADTSIVYAGTEALAIGVELHELVYDSQGGRFLMKQVDEPLGVRVGDDGAGDIESVLLFEHEDDGGDVFVALPHGSHPATSS